MDRIKTTVLTAILLSVLGTAEAQKEGTVQGGAQRTFSISDLTNDRLGRIVASSNYQVSIVLPAEVQNMGINASKQSSLVPTVDKSDGRVVYLDVLKPGGYATLNIRLVSEGEPLILKLTVELGEATSGVLTYTIAAAPPSQIPQKPAATMTAEPRPEPPILAPAQPAAPAAPLPVQVAPRVAVPTAAPSIRPMPVDERRVVNVQVPPAQAVSSAGRSALPSNPVVRQQDGLHVEVSIAPGQSGSDRTVTYRIRDVLGTDNLTYILAPKVTVRESGQSQPQATATMPNVYQRVTADGIQGTFKMKVSALPPGTSAVVLFEVRPVDTKTQKPLPVRYVGVMVRPSVADNLGSTLSQSVIFATLRC